MLDLTFEVSGQSSAGIKGFVPREYYAELILVDGKQANDFWQPVRFEKPRKWYVNRCHIAAPRCEIARNCAFKIHGLLHGCTYIRD
jgi:hypothetical protein